jgi:hypothetical protein
MDHKHNAIYLWARVLKENYLQLKIYLVLEPKSCNCVLYGSLLHGLGLLACSVSELTSETMNPSRHFVRIPWMANQTIEDLNLCRTEQHRKTQTYIHASSRIRTHDLSV